MKITVNREEGITYPCLMVGRAGEIYLMQSVGCGMSVYAKGWCKPIYSASLDMDLLEPLKGSITLQND